MVKALEGDYRPAHVFTLTPSLALYDLTQQHMAACAQEIARVLGTLASLVDLEAPPLTPTDNRPSTTAKTRAGV
jgi:hypothetical protein